MNMASRPVSRPVRPQTRWNCSSSASRSKSAALPQLDGLLGLLPRGPGEVHPVEDLLRRADLLATDLAVGLAQGPRRAERTGEELLLHADQIPQQPDRRERATSQVIRRE
ncbi:MAG: hypothetical protein U5R48_08860 [Gammaproteobacteria bacterium]|nr:hypothetical protein [Gammaproteobacteria bacterium]